MKFVRLCPVSGLSVLGKILMNLSKFRQKATQVVRRLKHLLCRVAEEAGLVQVSKIKSSGETKQPRTSHDQIIMEKQTDPFTALHGG